MSDLERAKELIRDPAVTCAFVSGESELCFCEKGVKPLVSLVGKDLSDYSAADVIVGRAAAFLYELLGVRNLYAEVISSSAKRELERAGIHAEFAEETEYIVNRRGDGPCPMEEATRFCATPEQALISIRKKLRELEGK